MDNTVGRKHHLHITCFDWEMCRSYDCLPHTEQISLHLSWHLLCSASAPTGRQNLCTQRPWHARNCLRASLLSTARTALALSTARLLLRGNRQLHNLFSI